MIIAQTTHMPNMELMYHARMAFVITDNGEYLNVKNKDGYAGNIYRPASVQSMLDSNTTDVLVVSEDWCRIVACNLSIY